MSYLPPALPPPKRTSPRALWIGIAGLLVVLLGTGTWLGAGNDRVVAGQPLAAGALLTGSGARPSGTVPGGGKVITATDNKSQITVPDTWSPFPAKFRNDIAVIQMGDIRHERYVLVVTYAKADIADLAAFEQGALENTKGVVQDATVGARRTLTIGELPAAQYVITGTVGGVKVVYWYTLVDGKSGWYQVVGWTLQSKKDQEEAAIGQVISSFRETTPPGGH